MNLLKVLLISFFILTATFLFATKLYKYVDENGNIIWSGQKIGEDTNSSDLKTVEQANEKENTLKPINKIDDKKKHNNFAPISEKKISLQKEQIDLIASITQNISFIWNTQYEIMRIEKLYPAHRSALIKHFQVVNTLQKTYEMANKITLFMDIKSDILRLLNDFRLIEDKIGNFLGNKNFSALIKFLTIYLNKTNMGKVYIEQKFKKLKTDYEFLIASSSSSLSSKE